MFKRITTYCFIGFLILAQLACNTNSKRTNIEDDKYAVFQTILDSVYEAHEDAIGIIAHIEAPDKKMSWSGAVGLSNKITKETLKSDQPVLIASNTKTYVAVTILRLIEQGELKLEDPIFKYITNTSKIVLSEDGYDVYNITVRDLLSHTSGIFDYAETKAYLEKIIINPKHHWTRNEQIKFAMDLGEPLGNAGDVFGYSDTNYLLLTEVIESITNKAFHIAMRELIDYNALKLSATWFSSLETYPKDAKPMAYQYVSSAGLNSYNVNHSFDLYGGGGLAATAKDLALFSQSVFTNKVFKNNKILQLLQTKANPKQPMEGNYYLGLTSVNYNNIKGYGHNGFWGTVVNYFPELNASIAVVVLEQDQKHLRVDLNRVLVKALKNY
jgi:D-alanyl-D-alanine carboxypeptidase